MGFTERLAELTSERGSMARLSESTGLSTGLLSNYKNGTDPSLKNAVKIANALGVSLDYLAGRDGYSPSPLPAPETGGNPLSADEETLVSTFRSVTVHGKKAMLTNAKAVGEEYLPKSDSPEVAETMTARMGAPTSPKGGKGIRCVVIEPGSTLRGGI